MTINPDYTRVTKILEPFSGLRNLDRSVVENAANRGTATHKLCESLMKNYGKYELEELVAGYAKEGCYELEKEKVELMVESFEKWLEGKKIIKTSTRLYDDNHMITGEYDLIYSDPERGNILVDIKTPVSESKTWMLQGSAYDFLSRSHGQEVHKIEFLKLDRKGKMPMAYTYKPDWPLFLQVYETWKYFYKDEQALDLMEYL